MHIVNVMFGRGRGGIEQAFADYSLGLHEAGHTVTPICRSGASILPTIQSFGLTPRIINNLGEWDIIAASKLRSTLLQLKPDIVVAHGNRAIALMLRAARNLCPVVGVAHNYSISRFGGLDACIAITRDLVEELVHIDVARKQIFYIPNMIKIDSGFVHAGYHAMPVIGTMGRFVKKKGFKFFIDVVAELKERGVSFKALLGGDGEEKDFLHRYAERTNVGDVLEFIGWVEDKKSFYSAIDIFCLPSHEEPFGIVLLEAFAAKVPVITTDADGPCDVVRPEADAILVERGDVEQMADAIQRLLGNEALARELTKNAYDKIKSHYRMPVVSAQIVAALEATIAHYYSA